MRRPGGRCSDYIGIGLSVKLVAGCRAIVTGASVIPDRFKVHFRHAIHKVTVCAQGHHMEAHIKVFA